MDYLAEWIETSLRRQEAILRSSLILNPAENFPFPSDIQPASSFVHGLYNSDKTRTPREQLDTTIQFAGRGRIAFDSKKIYRAWADKLGAFDVSLRLLSGLHAHTVLFMAMSHPTQKVLLLPEEAGGHMSTKSILERLGIQVIEMAVDNSGMSIDLARTLQLANSHKPDFLFVDRSEGLVFEDFSRLVDHVDIPSIFDASQYLSNILAGDYPNPFSIGFEYIVSTLHKNFPSAQKALIATRTDNTLWRQILSGIATFVSNMHSFSTYSAGLTLARDEWLSEYSRRMLENAVELEKCLAQRHVNAVRRSTNQPPTHHVWIQASSRAEAFDMFKRLERVRILVNYRKLPYGLGYGLRLGTSAATRLGLRVDDIPELCSIIADALDSDGGLESRRRAREFNEALWDSRPRLSPHLTELGDDRRVES